MGINTKWTAFTMVLSVMAISLFFILLTNNIYYFITFIFIN